MYLRQNQRALWGFFHDQAPNIEYLETNQIGAFYGVFWRDIPAIGTRFGLISPGGE